METWTINSTEKSKLDIFEIWRYRKILKIPTIERITNEDVLERIKEKRQLWHTIRIKRDGKW